jgi:hypothetical protein
MEPDRLWSVVAPDDVYRSMTIQSSASRRGLSSLGFWSRRRLLRALMSVVAFVVASGCASPDSLRAAVTPPVTQAGAETTLEGNVEVVIEDSAQGSRTFYFLIVGDRRVPLRFTTRPLNLTSGTRVRVRGRWEPDDALLVTAIEKL